MTTVKLYRTALSFRIKVTTQGFLAEAAHVDLYKYLDKFTEFSYDHRTRRTLRVRRYVYFNHIDQMLHLPIYDLEAFCVFLGHHRLSYDIINLPLCQGLSVDIPMKPEFSPRDDRQFKAIDYLAHSDQPLRGLALQTGCLSGLTMIDFKIGKKIFKTGICLAAALWDGIDFGVEFDTQEYWNKYETVYVRSFDGVRIRWHPIEDIVFSGIKPVIQITLSDGKHIDCTEEHLILTISGWIEAKYTLCQWVICDVGPGQDDVVKIARVVNVKYLGYTATYDIVCKDPYHNFVANGMVIHNSGKTYSTLKALSMIGRRAMIFPKGLVGQWVEAIEKFTDLKPEEVYVIQGADSVAKILSQIDRNLFPKLIVCSISTIRFYCNDQISYQNYPPFNEFFDRLNTGVRIIDEGHLEFHINMMLDLRLTPAKTIILTATFGRENKYVKHIFDNHYPTEIRHGEGDYQKYVDIFAYSYSTGYDDIPARAYTLPKGYNHGKLEAWLLHPKRLSKLLSIYRNVYQPIIQGHYINEMKPGQKLLVLCSSIEMCKWLEIRLGIDYPELKSSIYIYETDDSILTTEDIIISTPGSAGTGRDVKNLKTVFATISVGAININKQILGRLRVLPDPTDAPIFVYAYHRNIAAQVRHHIVRKDLYIQFGKSYTHIDL